MKTRDFAAENIVFNKTSPVTGAFRLPMYPFLGKPMDASDDIRVKRLVIFKASSCLGTVLGQVINAKRIACDVGDQMMVCQTNDDAVKWTKTRGKEWLESVPSVMRLLKNDKYAQTNELWLFRHKFLIITGPGITSAQSDQVRYVQTDESHLEEYPQGRLTEFEKRMGARWDRQSTHITTAPDEGREVHGFWLESSQEEWHWRCVKCNGLILPCWSDLAKERYNGEMVFKWDETQSENETLDSIKAVCPHCSHEIRDNPRERYDVSLNGDYVAFNSSAPIESAGFQWPVWAAHWIPWRESLAEWLTAIKAAKNGDLKKLEDFTKKRECRPYKATIPDFGETKIGKFHIRETQLPETRRFANFDFQEGKKGEGLHWWGQCDEYDLGGNSRRVDYVKLQSWADCRAFQKDLGAADADTAIDAGHRPNEVFANCAEWKWMAMIASDDDIFHHAITLERGTPRERKVLVPHQYFTQTKPQNSLAGKAIKALRKKSVVVRGLPVGWCLSRTWSKPNVGFLLLRLKAGNLPQTFGIPIDINEEYTKQLNSYMEAEVFNKQTGAMKRILKNIRESDHSFGTSCLGLIGAIRTGYFPLSTQQPTEEKAA